MGTKGTTPAISNKKAAPCGAASRIRRRRFGPAPDGGHEGPKKNRQKENPPPLIDRRLPIIGHPITHVQRMKKAAPSGRPLFSGADDWAPAPDGGLEVSNRTMPR